jgi:DNA-binding NarL/FixJ family response regulator
MAPSSPPTQRTPSQHATLLVDDDADLRDTVGDLLSLHNLGDCVRAASLAEVEAQRAEVVACSFAILDINLGANQPTGIDIYRWLKRAQFSGRIVFLTGYNADDPLVKEAARIEVAPILSKPISASELVALVAEAQGFA